MCRHLKITGQLACKRIGMGVKTAFMLKWQCSAIIVSRVQLSHKLYNNGDGLIKLPYNVPFFSAFKLYCSVLSHSKEHAEHWVRLITHKSRFHQGK